MADDNIVRSYRSVGPARRPGAPAGSRDAGARDPRDIGSRDIGSRDTGARDAVGRNDPLAELARLIGQSDPFADFGQKSTQSSQSNARNSGQAAPAPAQ